MTENSNSHLAAGGAEAIRGQTGRTATDLLHVAIMYLPCKPYDGTDAYTHYCQGHRDARHAAAELALAAAPSADKAEAVPAATFVLSDVDPVVLEVWKLQGRKVGAMLADAQAAVIELQEALADAAPPTLLPREVMEALESGQGVLDAYGKYVSGDAATSWLVVRDAMAAWCEEHQSALVKLREQLKGTE